MKRTLALLCVLLAPAAASARGMTVERVNLALVNAHIERRDTGRILAGADDHGAEFLLQGLVAADMIIVVMGVENVGELEAALPQARPHGFCLRGVDNGANLLAGGIDQPGVIVA
jgi:hypothetical protein